MKRFGVFFLLLVVVFAVRFWRVRDNDDKVLKEMKSTIAEFEFYQADAAYLDQMLERQHPTAFDSAYTVGGRRRPDKFDGELYLDNLFGGMAQQCRRDGKKDLAEALVAARASLTYGEND